MAEDLIVDDTEYSGNQEEEDPILVAQRYLNIFHQIHIFNQAKKDEFDQSLLNIPEKIKELLATLPGGRVFLEHVKEVEEKQGKNSGDTSELIAQNIKEEKKSIDSLKQHQGTGSELSLGADFAESLATSLAAALQNNNIASGNANSGGNMAELANMLNKSFNAYAASMQTLTNRLVSQTNTTALQQTAAVAPLQPTGMAAQQQNNSSTTVNNINMDTSYFNNINQTLMQSDARRHEDMMQIVAALNKNILNSGSLNVVSAPAATATQVSAGVVTAVNSEMQTLALANSLTEALRQNSSQQLEAIKSFGEMLVQAITQSQQELAQTLAQSAPRHTVKVVVSQDVDVEDQTGGSAAISKPQAPSTPIVQQPKKNENNSIKTPEQAKDKNNFIKSFSDKISETTNKLTQNLSNDAKNTSDTLLSRINKSLNKINDLKNQNKNNQQPNKKADEKNSKKDNQTNENKKNEQQPAIKDKQPKPAPKPEPVKEQPKPTPKPEPVKEQSKPAPKPEPVKEQPKPAPKPEPVKEQPKPTPKPEPVKEQPKPAPKPEPVKEQSKPAPKPEPVKEQSNDEPLSIEDILAAIPSEGENSSEPDIFSDNSFGAPAADSKPDIFSDDSFGAPAADNKPDIFSDDSFGVPAADSASAPAKTIAPEPKSAPVSQPAADLPDEKEPQPQEYKKSQLHSYEDALLKIKNALSSDNDVSLNNLDIKPVSLGGGDDLPKPQTPHTPAPQPKTSAPVEDGSGISDGDDWEYVDENGNPVSGDSDGEWEYVDENGNPVSGDDDSDWEYVDENGNPVSGDSDGDWEYVDENGNPVSGDDDGDWEYVDENGNPLPSNRQ